MSFSARSWFINNFFRHQNLVLRLKSCIRQLFNVIPLGCLYICYIYPRTILDILDVHVLGFSDYIKGGTAKCCGIIFQGATRSAISGTFVSHRSGQDLHCFNISNNLERSFFRMQSVISFWSMVRIRSCHYHLLKSLLLCIDVDFHFHYYHHITVGVL